MGIHNDKHWKLFDLFDFFLKIFLQLFILLRLVVDDIVHNSVKGLLRTVCFYFLDGRIDDWALKFLRKSISERVVGTGHPVDGGDSC